MTPRRTEAPEDARTAAVPMDPRDVLRELEETLAHAQALARRLAPAVTADVVAGNAAGDDGGPGALAARMTELQQRLSDVEQDRADLSIKLAEYEQQSGRLMNLYVATYQLHATLDPAEVVATIAEIAINLLGAERFALLFWKGESDEVEVALAHGLEDDTGGLYAGGRYAGGDPMVDATLADGVLRMGAADGSDALAAVPLAVQGDTVGALVILKLFEHKAALRPEDRDLLDLIAAHAASALFAARVYSQTDRKLKTLESLVKLVRRG